MKGAIDLAKEIKRRKSKEEKEVKLQLEKRDILAESCLGLGVE